MLERLPPAVMGLVAEQADNATLLVIGSISTPIRNNSANAFAERYFRSLDVNVPQGSQAQTLALLRQQPVYRTTVSKIIFTDLTGDMHATNQRIYNINSILALVPRVESISIQTARGFRFTDIVFTCLRQTPLAGLRHVHMAGDEDHPRPPRARRADVVALLTTHRQTIRTLYLETAMFSSQEWEPILVYIRDHMVLEEFVFSHCEYENEDVEPLITIDPARLPLDLGAGEGYHFHDHVAEMYGVLGIRRGVNRLLHDLGLASYDPHRPM